MEARQGWSTAGGIYAILLVLKARNLLKGTAMKHRSSDIARLVPGPDYALLKGVMFGLALGAVGAAVLAPRRGAATRELLRERGLELKDRADAMLRGRGNSSPL